MELTYKFGRGNWRTIEEGQEREWLMGNGIGGYSGQTIVNSGFRSFHAYLVASLNSTPLNVMQFLHVPKNK